MLGNSNIKWTLTIWRDFLPARPLALPSDQGNRVLDSDSGLQEQVYSWRMREDAFAGIPDEETRKGLHDRLLSALDDSKSPADRRLGVLEGFVQEAESLIKAGKVSWSPSQSRSDEDADHEDGSQVQINSLLALTTHLKWILACFGDRPGISVLVR